jgi:tetratricopeptide (TPR) repeat protein
VVDDLLKLIANPINQGILSLLAAEPSYPRRIGVLLSISEAEVARRVKQMETAGLLTSAWSYIGKNVKLYRLSAERLTVTFSSEGIRVETATAEAAQAPLLLNPLKLRLPDPGWFVGRSEQLAQLEANPRVMIVEGLPGIGKSSLLAQYASSAAQKQRVYWHTFRGVESLRWLANHFAVFLAQAGDRHLLERFATTQEDADLLQAIIQGIDHEQTLIILDDVHAITETGIHAFLAEAIRNVRHARIIIAGRQRPRVDPTIEGVNFLTLEGLTDPEVLTFLEGKGVRLDPNFLPALHDEVGGHPLALNLIVETAAQLKVPLETLLDRVPESNLQDWLLKEVYGSLSEDERRILSHASLFRTGFTLDALRALSKKNPEPPLLKLRARQLIHSDAAEFQLHSIMRNFFYSLLEDKPALHAKVAEFLVSQGTLEGRLEAMHHFLQAGRRERILTLLEQNVDLAEFDFIDAGYHDLHLSMLELFSRDEVKDSHRWAMLLDEKGDIWFHRGNHAKALKYYDEAVETLPKKTEKELLADLAWKRALCHERLGKDSMALEIVKKALQDFGTDGQHGRRLEDASQRLATARPRKARAKA